MIIKQFSRVIQLCKAGNSPLPVFLSRYLHLYSTQHSSSNFIHMFSPIIENNLMLVTVTFVKNRERLNGWAGVQTHDLRVYGLSHYQLSYPGSNETVQYIVPVLTWCLAASLSLSSLIITWPIFWSFLLSCLGALTINLEIKTDGTL